MYISEIIFVCNHFFSLEKKNPSRAWGITPSSCLHATCSRDCARFHHSVSSDHLHIISNFSLHRCSQRTLFSLGNICFLGCTRIPAAHAAPQLLAPVLLPDFLALALYFSRVLPDPLLVCANGSATYVSLQIQERAGAWRCQQGPGTPTGQL